MKESWEDSASWYDRLVGDEGQPLHQKVILPRLLPLFDLKAYPAPSLLDLGAGQGVLERHLPPSIRYVGIDLSSSLIKTAKQKAKSPEHQFLVGDFTKPLPLEKEKFTHAVFLLSLQNTQGQKEAIREASKALLPSGTLVLVLNHPCFRIPRQSSWGIDEQKKLQYRRIDRYLSPLSIPILMHPGQKHSETTLTHHYPLSHYSRFLFDAGLAIHLMEEWCSDKKSVGKWAKMEDRARDEFPLFLAIKAVKR